MRIWPLLIALMLCPVARGQQSVNGAYFPPPSIQTVPAYGGTQAGGATNSGTSPLQFAIAASLPSNVMVLGVIVQNGTSGTITSVCDGTGATGCTGSDTFTLETTYANASNFQSTVFYTCLTASATSANITINWTGSPSFTYASAIEIWGAPTSGCIGGYAHNQNTGTASTAYTTSPNTLSPSTVNSLMVGLSTNSCSGTFTAGNDGKGNSYTLQADKLGVTDVETLQETSIQAYIATGTGPSCKWNMEAVYVPAANTTGTAVGWGINGANFPNTTQVNGAFFTGASTGAFLWDMHGSTNGVAPTAANVYSSSYGLSGSGVISVARIDTMVYSNTMQPITLVTPTIISGAGYGGGGGLGISSPTRSGGQTYDEVVVTAPSPSASSGAIGYSFYTSCPASTTGFDCSSLSGFTSGGTSTSYATVHILQGNQVSGLSAIMEDFTAPGGTSNIVYFPIQPNTLYRANIQINSSGNDYAKLCDSGNRVIYTWTNMAVYNQSAISLRLGQVGEVPTSAGYNYYFWNFVYDNAGTSYTLNGPCF